MMYQDIYNCICQNTKKIKIHYVKPTAQLLFKNRFPKGYISSRQGYVWDPCLAITFACWSIIRLFQSEVTTKIMGKCDDVNLQELMRYPQQNKSHTRVHISWCIPSPLCKHLGSGLKAVVPPATLFPNAITVMGALSRPSRVSCSILEGTHCAM